MIRRILQSTLCLFLSPALVAQQVSQQTLAEPPSNAVPADAASPTQSPTLSAASIPGSTKIELVPVDAPIDETAQVGEPVRFTVAQAVVVNGATAIPIGTPVTAYVTESRHASHRIANDGKLTIRARDLKPGKVLFVRVKDVPLLLAPYGPIPWNGQSPITTVSIAAAVVLILVLGMKTH
jgi:hypothetical protein